MLQIHILEFLFPLEHPLNGAAIVLTHFWSFTFNLIWEIAPGWNFLGNLARQIL